MSKDLNKVMIIGRLGQDPELRYTPKGSAVCSFSVASGRSYTTAAGEKHDETEWFNLVAWNKLGEICNQYLVKGSRVYAEGRIKTESWEDKESGQKRYRTTVVVGEMIILDGRNSESFQADDTADEEAPQAPVAARQAPQATQARQPAPQPAQRQQAPQNGAQRGNQRSSGAAASAYSRSQRNVPQNIENEEDLPF